MKIRTKIILSFFLVAFLGSIYGTTHFYVTSSNIIKEEIFNHLQSVANDRADHIETYLKQNIERLKLVTSRSKLRATLQEYNNSPSQEKAREMQGIIVAAKESVEEIERVCVVGLDGKIITSTDNNFCGKNIGEDFLFEKGREDNIVYFIEENGVKKIFVAGPFILDGEVLGVGITVVETKALEDIVKDRTGLGKTGEVSIAIQGDNERIYIFDRLFEEEAIDQKNESEKSSEPMKQALQKRELFFENSLDYRDKQVIAVSQYIDVGSVGLVAKIDRSEALRAVFFELFRTALIILVIIVIAITSIGYLVAKSISGPIEKLEDGIEIVEKGDLNHKVGIDARDEVGQLSRAFDKMTQAIKDSRSNAELKVEEQTKELASKKEELENQQKAILNILEDVQEEKVNVEREKDKIKAILYSIGDGVFVVDRNYRITVFNKIAAKISGYEMKEAIGKKYDEVLKFEFEKEGRKNDEFIKGAMQTGNIKEMSNHTVIVRKNGKKVPVADSAAPLKDKQGRVVGCVVVFRDVTSEREIDRAKSEFVSLASHQLRTPLSAINWYAEMLISGDAGNLTKEQKDYLQEIYKGNQRMVDLVNALLNVSRIELGTLAIESTPTDLIEVSNSVLSELTPIIKEKEIKIEKNYENDFPKINLDPKIIRVVFQNLLSNAVKYTPEEGVVGINIKKQKDNACIEVYDTGYGIPEEQQSKIFTKLFRADNVRQRETDGTGLGLYIVKSIVEQMNGKIWFESKENEGTKFFIAIPLKGIKPKKGSKGLTSEGLM